MNNKSNVTNRVMQDIKSGHTTMRPRWWFVGATVSAIVGLLASTMVAIYLIGMFVLRVRISLMDRPAYGMRRNLAEMASSFPWWYLLIALLGLGAAFWIIKKLDFSYKIKMHYLILAAGLAVLALGIIGGLMLHPGNQSRQYKKASGVIHNIRFKN